MFEHSISRKWLETEIRNAREKELKNNIQVLFPISLSNMIKLENADHLIAMNVNTLQVKLLLNYMEIEKLVLQIDSKKYENLSYNIGLNLTKPLCFSFNSMEKLKYLRTVSVYV